MLTWLLPAKSLFRARSSKPCRSNDLPEIPKDTLGLRILTPQTFEADVDIVAVHGLGGDAFKTWSSENGQMWLRDFLPKQLKGPPVDFANGPNDSKTARVMTFEYNANIFTSAPSARSFEFAEEFLSALKDKRRNENARHRPLILIGHSLGGIVIKKALHIAHARQKQWGDLLYSVIHLCFFGTPHQGARSLPGFLLRFGEAITTTENGDILKELKLWSSPLIEIDALFVEISEGFTITTFYEGRNYNGIKVVEEGSTRLNKSKETVIRLDGDHKTMCQFPSSEDPSYLKVFSRLHAEISAIGTAEQVQDHEQRLKLLLEVDKIQPDDRERDKILAWLDYPKISSRPPRDVHGEPGTNLWFLEGKLLRSWNNGKNKFILLHGMVGCGKTTLLRAIEDQCRDDPSSSNLVIAFFFSSTTNTGLNLNAFLRAVATQLSIADPISDHLRKLFQKNNEGIIPPTNGQLAGVIEKIISERPLQHVKILIDGIDEAQRGPSRLDLLQHLSDISTWGLENLHVLATSRSEDDILLALDLHWKVLPIPSDRVRGDIEIYIKNELRRRTRLKELDENVQKQVISALAGPDQSMFRWTALQLERLLKSGALFQKNITHILRTLPSTLNETYDVILNGIGEEPEKKVAAIALRWLTSAHHPLLIEELIEACKISFDQNYCIDIEQALDARDILGLLPGLIILEPDVRPKHPNDFRRGKHHALLAHFSVREYLLRNENAWEILGKSRLSPVELHRWLSRSCIAYLCETNTLTKRALYYLLRSYAWDSWALHAVAENDVPNSKDELRASELFERVIRHHNDPGRIFSIRDLSSLELRLPIPLETLLSGLAVSWTIHDIMSSLQNPYFSEEYPESRAKEDLEPIWHTPLSPGKKEIRLLRLYPSRYDFAMIRCALETVSLGSRSPPKYEAMSYSWGMSYTWGERNMLQSHIWLSGRPYQIQPTLASNLRAIRRGKIECCILWVDSTCINHNDPQEVEYQVKFVPSIFSRASRATICFDRADKEDYWALDVLLSVGAVLANDSEANISALRNVLDISDDHDPFRSISMLFDPSKHEWWLDMWVVKEYVSARAIALQYGSRTLPYEIMDKLSTSLEAIANCIENAMPLSTGSKCNRSHLLHSYGLTLAKNLFHLRTLHFDNNARAATALFLARFFKMYFPTHRFCSLQGIMSPSHFSLNDDESDYPCRYSEVDRPRRYNESIQELCARFCVGVINSERNLGIFSILRRKGDNDACPSWASQFSQDPDNVYPLPLLIDELMGDIKHTFNAGCADWAPPQFERPDKLHLQGFIVDTLTEPRDLPVGYAQKYNLQRFAELRRWCKTKERGFEGLVPLEAEKGDRVVVLFGGKTPYILRPRQNRNNYHLIDEW
ncbi:uncharacterized protein F4822DRAFT_409788 [Hypoxylon trugodes]|uniref:uncharacterized protein n=1 Tax=Hypoxylon trugodes TaxID=326681 RepID=UPI00219906D0|nr:uncharacterized protein F4822DRAFT_409788 [Hypoxylon trugodes]KAI1386356.1 hypothetical protein F4822DRAFT_409788 [Hypoxylon trugodes]